MQIRLKKLLTNERFLLATPFLTTLLLENGNIQQLLQMWTERTAEGQSLLGWISVQIALLLWFNFYGNKLEGSSRKTALLATAVGCVFNFSVILSVVYFRYVVA